MTELGFKPKQSGSEAHALNHHCRASVLFFLESEFLKQLCVRITYFIFIIIYWPLIYPGCLEEPLTRTTVIPKAEQFTD